MQTGFTLIEIMIVLAISGLLILAVFDAFTFGQRIHRDDKRKEDLQLVAKNLDELKDSTDYSHYYPWNTDIQTCDGTLSVFECFFDPTKAPLPGHPSYAIPNGIDPLSNTPYQYEGAGVGFNGASIGSEADVAAAPTGSNAAVVLYRLGWPCSVSITTANEANYVAKSPTNGFNAGVFRLEISLEQGGPYCLDNH